MADITDTEIDFDTIGFVTSSRYRSAVLDALGAGPATPSQLVERIDSIEQIAHVSRSLTALRERDLVELLVPEDRKKGRYYGLTDRGERIGKARDELPGGGGRD